MKTFVCCVILLVCLTSQAKAPKKGEQYSAIEPNQEPRSHLSLEESTDEEIDAEKPKAHKKQAKKQVERELRYDPVPSEQTQAIAQRLDITKKILVNYGRAYDYRTATLRELNAVWLQLEKNK